MEGAEHATVVATGRPDFPNQINSVLAFPGLLDAGACEITSEVLAAAAWPSPTACTRTSATRASSSPACSTENVAPAVAEAVKSVAEAPQAG